MEPVNFPGCNGVLNPKPGTENEVNPLPFHVDKTGIEITSCWQLTEEEKQEVMRTGRVYFTVYCGRNFYPVRAAIFNPLTQNQFAYCLVRYSNETNASIIVWCSGDFELPAAVMYKNDFYFFNAKGSSNVPMKNVSLNNGDLYFRMPIPEEVILRKQWIQSKIEGMDIDPNEVTELLNKLDVNSEKMPLLVEKLQAGEEKVWC